MIQHFPGGFFCAQRTLLTLFTFPENWVFAFLELGFLKFWTEFCQISQNCPDFSQNLVIFFGKFSEKVGFGKIWTGFYGWELGFLKIWLSGFSKIQIWVFRFCTKKPCRWIPVTLKLDSILSLFKCATHKVWWLGYSWTSGINAFLTVGNANIIHDKSKVTSSIVNCSPDPLDPKVTITVTDLATNPLTDMSMDPAVFCVV